MSKTNDCPAFPSTHPHGTEDGMTLRDYFAAKALPAVYAEAMKDARKGSGLLKYDNWREGLAIDVYMMADAMIKARNEGELLS